MRNSFAYVISNAISIASCGHAYRETIPAQEVIRTQAHVDTDWMYEGSGRVVETLKWRKRYH